MAGTPEDECFFITPIGAEGSPERERADGVLDVIVRPAAEAVGLRAVRADLLGEPGQITRQVVDHVLTARAAVADLTGRNANVFWELGVRHAFQKPVVLIAQEGQELPFDVFSMRTIFYDSQSFASAGKARESVIEQLRNAMDGAVESPVSTSVDLASLQRGGSLERSVAELISHVQELAAEQRNQASRVAALQDTLRRLSADVVRTNPYSFVVTGADGSRFLVGDPPFSTVSDFHPVPSTLTSILGPSKAADHMEQSSSETETEQSED